VRRVLQGSVDTLVRWGGQLSCHAMSNYVRNFGVKIIKIRQLLLNLYIANNMSGCFFLKHGVHPHLYRLTKFLWEFARKWKAVDIRWPGIIIDYAAFVAFIRKQYNAFACTLSCDSTAFCILCLYKRFMHLEFDDFRTASFLLFRSLVCGQLPPFFHSSLTSCVQLV